MQPTTYTHTRAQIHAEDKVSYVCMCLTIICKLLDVNPDKIQYANWRIFVGA